MKTATNLLMMCILLGISGQAMASGSQTDTQRKAEFRKLILQRNRLHSKLQQRDRQAAALIKQSQDATRINAEQVTIQDKLDLLQLRLEATAARYDYEIPDFPAKNAAGQVEHYGRNAFERGRRRTTEELKRQTLRLLASIDYSQFRAKLEVE